MRPRFLLLALAFTFVFGGAVLRAAPHDKVLVPPVKTSIYVGSVTLIATPLMRVGGGYEADYQAKVFPFFFMGERGRLRIEFSDEQLAQITRGERVAYVGSAQNTDGEPRRLEGQVEPRAADAPDGKIKVRIFVSPKIQLIFNTTYRFDGA
jgi:hypothetical protein